MHLPFSKVTKLFACGMCASHLTKNIIISDSKAACLTHKKILFFRQGKLQKTALGTKNTFFCEFCLLFFISLFLNSEFSAAISNVLCWYYFLCYCTLNYYATTTMQWYDYSTLYIRDILVTQFLFFHLMKRKITSELNEVRWTCARCLCNVQGKFVWNSLNKELSWREIFAHD